MTQSVEFDIQVPAPIELDVDFPDSDSSFDVTIPGPRGPQGIPGPQGDPGVPGEGADPRVGDLEDLTTQEKETLVGALNEVNMPPVSFRALYNNAKAG